MTPTAAQLQSARHAVYTALVESGLYVTHFDLDAIARRCADAVLAALPDLGRER